MANCSICLEQITNPCCCVPCGHVFCQICISEWVKRENRFISTCPQCRRSIQNFQSIIMDSTQGGCRYTTEWKLNLFLQNIGLKIYSKLLPYQERLEASCRDLWQRYGNGQELSLNNISLQLQTIPNMGLTKWRQIPDDKKIVYGVIFIILLSCIIVDLQSPLGISQSILFPVISAIGNIFCELLICIGFIILRPIYFLMICVKQLGLALCDIMLVFLNSVLKIIQLILCIPLSICSAIWMWIDVVGTKIFQIVTGVLRLFIVSVPFGIVAYHVHPDFQLFVRRHFLQHNRQA